MQRAKRLSMCLWMLALCVSCSNATSPDRVSPPLAASEIDRLFVFVRDWPDSYVEIDFQRHPTGSTLLVSYPLTLVNTGRTLSNAGSIQVSTASMLTISGGGAVSNTGM